MNVFSRVYVLIQNLIREIFIKQKKKKKKEMDEKLSILIDYKFVTKKKKKL